MVAEGGRGKSVNRWSGQQNARLLRAPARQEPERVHCTTGQKCQARARDGDAECHWVEKQIGGKKIYDFRVDV